MTNTKKEIMETLSMVISEMGYTPKAVVNETLNISYDGLTYVPETSETCKGTRKWRYDYGRYRRLFHKYHETGYNLYL